MRVLKFRGLLEQPLFRTTFPAVDVCVTTSHMGEYNNKPRNTYSSNWSRPTEFHPRDCQA
jgi:hypothetical protein